MLPKLPCSPATSATESLASSLPSGALKATHQVGDSKPMRTLRHLALQRLENGENARHEAPVS